MPAILAPETPPPSATAARRTMRLAPALDLPERTGEVGRTAQLSASFSEHGLFTQSRDFVRTAYQPATCKKVCAASFRARSVVNASALRLS